MPVSSAPDLGALEIPMDQWTQPFWEATARGELLLPRCGACRRFRWPPGPFCPDCHSQRIDWRPAGPAVLYSYTVVAQQASAHAALHIPALVEFPRADGVRLLAAIIDAQPAELRIGAPLTLGWRDAANARIPVFRLA